MKNRIQRELACISKYIGTTAFLSSLSLVLGGCEENLKSKPNALALAPEQTQILTTVEPEAIEEETPEEIEAEADTEVEAEADTEVETEADTEVETEADTEVNIEVVEHEGNAEDYPLEILEPASAFTSDGSLRIKIRVAKGFYDQVLLKSSLAEATVQVRVEDFSENYTFKISDSGLVEPIRINKHGMSVEGYFWYLDLDLTKAQCRNYETRVHHCDGCGRSFTTGDGKGSNSCKLREVAISLSITNKPGNSVCGLTPDSICQQVEGTLESTVGEVVYKYVPEKFWEQQEDGSMACVGRSHSGVLGNSCKALENQGCEDCEIDTSKNNDDSSTNPTPATNDPAPKGGNPKNR